MSSKNLLLEKLYQKDFASVSYKNDIFASPCTTPVHLAFCNKDVHKIIATECKENEMNSFPGEYHIPLSSNSSYRENYSIQKNLSSLEVTDETKNVEMEESPFKNKCKYQNMEQNSNIERKSFSKEAAEQSDNKFLLQDEKILLKNNNSDYGSQSNHEVWDGMKYFSENNNKNFYERESLLREIYTCFLAIELVYVLNNIIFNNCPAGVITLLILICAIFAHLDRRSGSYILIGILSLCMGIVISVAINKELDGFNLYFSHSLLRVVSIFHICASFFFSFLSFFLAFFRMQFKLFMPHMKFEDKESETNDERNHEELKKIVTKEATFTHFGDVVDIRETERRRKSSEDKNKKYEKDSSDLDKKVIYRDAEGLNFQN